MDLNELPTDLVDEGVATTGFPSYCTQPAPGKEVGEEVHNEVNAGSSHNGSMHITTSIPNDDDDINDEQFPEDEVLSQPHEPYLGMRFDTLLCAKDHYNNYALRVGFSIRSSTSRRSLYTNEMEKQLFVCNKFRKPKADGEPTKKAKVAPDVSSDSKVGSEEETDREEDLPIGKKAPNKRRRETIKGTNCKARMIVKLLDSRWQVIYFIAEHNHPLIIKPSLTKYLRSHQGIPKEEENFLRILHDSNLETGRMMQLMSSFYGSGLLIPYTTKAISNYRGWAEMMETHQVAGNKYIAWLYNIRATWVPCYFRNCFFPFLQSTQRSEGINVVLKCYVNPHNSILNFVHQHEKIQLKILVKEGGNDYRTDHLHVDTWSSYPIEKQALEVYTRDIYYRFRSEFEMIGRYNVRPLQNDIYELIPNRKYCCNYGTRAYKVTDRVDEASYSCECCKFQKDRLLCCYILKIFTHCSIDEIPQHYILKRCTQQAIREEVAPEQDQPDVMPKELEKEIRLANMSVELQKVARKACGSDAAKQIVDKHVRTMWTELSHLNKTRKPTKKTAATAPSPRASASVPLQPEVAPTVRNSE
ncbi:hypothetical protein BRADI_2g55935v3, partial [Brachypodium distachyon]